MKTFAGFIVGIMLAGSVCGLGRRHPQPALPGGFPAKGTFVLTDADGRVRFDLEFGKDSLRMFRYRISDAADSLRYVSAEQSSCGRKTVRIEEAAGRPFRPGDRVTVVLKDGRRKTWRYTPYLP